MQNLDLETKKAFKKWIIATLIIVPLVSISVLTYTLKQIEFNKDQSRLMINRLMMKEWPEVQNYTLSKLSSGEYIYDRKNPEEVKQASFLVMGLVCEATTADKYIFGEIELDDFINSKACSWDITAETPKETQ